MYLFCLWGYIARKFMFIIGASMFCGCHSISFCEACWHYLNEFYYCNQLFTATHTFPTPSVCFYWVNLSFVKQEFESWIIMFKASFLIIVMFDGTWSKQWLQSFIILLCTEKIAVFHFLEGYLFLGWQAPTYVTTYSHLRLLRCAHLTW